MRVSEPSCGARLGTFDRWRGTRSLGRTFWSRCSPIRWRDSCRNRAGEGRHQVVLLNDLYTPMWFVVRVSRRGFSSHEGRRHRYHALDPRAWHRALRHLEPDRARQDRAIELWAFETAIIERCDTPNAIRREGAPDRLMKGPSRLRPQ